MGTLKKNGNPKTEKGPHGDLVRQMGTHLAAVVLGSGSYGPNFTSYLVYFFSSEACSSHSILCSVHTISDQMSEMAINGFCILLTFSRFCEAYSRF